MSKILAFAGSNSSTSINYELVKYTVKRIGNHEIQQMDMAYFPLPMFSEDYEKEHGYTNSLVELRDDLLHAEGLVLSVNEHNGYPSAYFKNLIDWLSRLERKFLENTKIFLMSTSPGKRGAIGSQEKVAEILTRFGGEIVATFSLPSFQENFSREKGILSPELAEDHQQSLQLFLDALSKD
jgi:NAD(P)H-dependent FMN reductase